MYYNFMNSLQTVSLPRPTVPDEFGAKIATGVRQVYLNKIIDECLKIYTEQQDAYDRVRFTQHNSMLWSLMSLIPLCRAGADGGA